MDRQFLKKFYQKFPSEQDCLNYLEAIRWPNGRACPHCASLKSYKFKRGKLFKCVQCKKQFTAKIGTIFTDSHVGLQDWFLAIELIFAQTDDISSVRLAEYLGITQKTAWLMMNRIKYALDFRIPDADIINKPSSYTLHSQTMTIDEAIKKISSSPSPKIKQ